MKEMKEPPECVGSSKKTGKRPKIVVVWYYYYYTVCSLLLFYCTRHVENFQLNDIKKVMPRGPATNLS